MFVGLPSKVTYPLKSLGDLDSYIMGECGYQPPPKISGLIASIKLKFYMQVAFGLYLLKKNSILLPEWPEFCLDFLPEFCFEDIISGTF